MKSGKLIELQMEGNSKWIYVPLTDNLSQSNQQQKVNMITRVAKNEYELKEMMAFPPAEEET